MATRRFLTSTGKALALALFVVSVPSVAVQAQRLSESRVGVALTPFATEGTLAQQAVDRKEPALAGVLSWIIPGVGSYYAGNSRHGTIHLGIAAVSLVMMVAGAAAAVEAVDPFTGEVSGGGLGLFAVGWLTYFVNDIWSIFTAVFDAQRHNNAGSSGGRVVGELQLAPELRGVGSSIPSPNAGMNGSRRLGLQVLRLRY